MLVHTSEARPARTAAERPAGAPRRGCRRRRPSPSVVGSSPPSTGTRRREAVAGLARSSRPTGPRRCARRSSGRMCGSSGGPPSSTTRPTGAAATSRAPRGRRQGARGLAVLLEGGMMVRPRLPGHGREAISRTGADLLGSVATANSLSLAPAFARPPESDRRANSIPALLRIACAPASAWPGNRGQRGCERRSTRRWTEPTGAI